MSAESPSLLALASNWYNTLRSISHESNDQSIDPLSLTPTGAPLTPSGSARSLLRSINQSINQTLRPINQSIKQAINQSSSSDKSNKFETIAEGDEIRASDQSNQTNNQSINQSINKPAQSDRLLPQVEYHRISQTSLLSSEDQSINLRGIMNLSIITLVVLTIRLMIENVIKYGWLIRMDLIDQLIDGLIDHPFNLPVLIGCFILFGMSPIITFYIEKYCNDALKLQTNKQSINQSTCQSITQLASILHLVHISTIFLLPQYLVTQFSLSFLCGMIIVFYDLVMTMKLVSIAHYGHAVRSRSIKQSLDQAIHQSSNRSIKDVDDNSAEHTKDHPNQSINQPIDITLHQILYFTAAPTLVFQQHYPRSSRIRIRFLVRRVLEFVILIALQLVLIEQYIMPTIKNSMPHFQKPFFSMDVPVFEQNVLFLLERILKLSIPSGFFWLFMFYSVFHSYLNVIGELLRFGDRLFYKDWWNCQSLDVYWRHWNLPVHAFIARHIYAPLLRSGMNAERAQLVCFTVSALAHEILISVPLHQVRGYVFVGMMAQIPLISITKYLAKRLKSPVYGNCIFWISFLVLGQPTIVLLICYSLQSAGMVTELVPLTPLTT